jgi:hypothetical protein
MVHPSEPVWGPLRAAFFRADRTARAFATEALAWVIVVVLWNLRFRFVMSGGLPISTLTTSFETYQLSVYFD